MQWLSYSRWCYDGDGALWREERRIDLKIRWREVNVSSAVEMACSNKTLHSFDVTHLGGV
jgi:hypothetical protein